MQDEHITEEQEVTEVKDLDGLYSDTEGKGAKIETDGGTEGKDKKNKKSTDSKKSNADKKIEKASMKEAMSAIFDGVDLPESFKERVETIFEAAVNSRVNELAVEINESNESFLEEQLNERVDTLIESINDYLSYVVSEWVEENEIAIENGLRTDISENLIRSLRDLLSENHIDLPEEKTDAFDSLSDKMETLECTTNDVIAENMELRKHLLESACTTIFANCTSDMVLTDIEKLKDLAEGFEYSSPQQYESKLNLIKKSYFEEATVATDEVQLNEEAGEPEKIDENLSVTPQMARYINTVTKLKA